MPTVIANSRAEKLGYTPDETAARKILSDLKLQITKPDGAIKSGVLSLRHTDRRSRKEMAFERKNWWQFCARRSENMEITANYLREIFTQAYGDYDEDTHQSLAFTRMMDDFEKYLAVRNNRVGTRTLHKYLIGFEKLFLQAKNPVPAKPDMVRYEAEYTVPLPPASWENGSAPALGSQEDPLFNEICKPNSTDREKDIIRDSLNLARSVVTRSDGKDPQLQHLGSGQFGIAYSFLDQNNRPQVFKYMTEEILCSVGKDAAMRGPEVCAARLLDETNIIKPTSYVIQKWKRIFNVPSGKLKSFLRNASPPVHMVGMFMPLAEGEVLSKKTDLSLQDLSFIGKESLNTLKDLCKRKFIHGDIKPDNIVFDSASRKLSFIDTGFLQKLSKKDKKPQYSHFFKGTPIFAHPSVLRGNRYGCEVDLFSLAFTLFSAQYPYARDIISVERVYRDSNKNVVATERNKSWEIPGGQYLKRCVAAASKSPYIEASSLAQLRSIQIALDKPKTEEGVFLDFVSKAIDVSFAKPEKYEAELEKLSQHPFLTAYLAHS